MNRTLSYFQTGREEGIMIVLQQLSVKDGFTAYPTKDYVVKKLTELDLTKYIDSIIYEFYTEHD